MKLDFFMGNCAILFNANPVFYILQPGTIGALYNLKDLWLDGNQLVEIPQVRIDTSWIFATKLTCLMK